MGFIGHNGRQDVIPAVDGLRVRHPALPLKIPLLEVIAGKGGRGIGHKGASYCPHPAWASLMSGDPEPVGKVGMGPSAGCCHL